MSRVLSDASTGDIGTRYTDSLVLIWGTLILCSERVLPLDEIFQKMRFSVKRPTEIMYITITSNPANLIESDI